MTTQLPTHTKRRLVSAKRLPRCTISLSNLTLVSIQAQLRSP